MKWRVLGLVAGVAVVVSACDTSKIPFIGKKSEPAAAVPATPAQESGGMVTQTTAPDSEPADAGEPTQPAPTEQTVEPAPAPQTPAAAVQTPRPRPAPRPVSRSMPSAQTQFGEIRYEPEIPWVPIAGTVSPGMTPSEVENAWGPPLSVTQVGNWTYMFFRNGCENRCGTYDVVFLEGNQVVDAVVRAPQHSYTGVSSSPPASPAGYTPPRRYQEPIGG